MDLSARIGTEKIQRQALLVLYEKLNEKILDFSAQWESEDDQFYYSLGRSNPGITIETIDEQNFIPGSIPSLINASVDRYPNVTCICYSARPQNNDDDTADIYSNILNIEVMVKSDNFSEDESHKGEEQVNTRIHKTLEAVHAVLIEDETLGNTVIGLNRLTQEIGNVFVRRQEKSRGPRWFWQGGYLEYAVDKYVNLA